LTIDDSILSTSIPIKQMPSFYILLALLCTRIKIARFIYLHDRWFVKLVKLMPAFNSESSGNIATFGSMSFPLKRPFNIGLTKSD
jgi:hypothetical protein